MVMPSDFEEIDCFSLRSVSLWDGCGSEPVFSFVWIPDRSRASCPRGDPFSHPSGSSAFGSVVWLVSPFEPKRARPCGSGLSPARFFVGTFRIPQDVPTRQDATGSCAQSRISGIQKTFSAGPRSFNSGELWFPTGKPAGVQPFSDSRHGRIVCKICFQPSNI